MLEDSDETVTATGNGLDVARIVGGVAERSAEFVHGRVEAVFEVDEGAFGPYLLAELLASDNLTRMCEQAQEDLKGLSRQTDAYAAFEQLVCGGIDFKRSEGQPDWRLGLSNHGLRRLEKKVYYAVRLNEVGG